MELDSTSGMENESGVDTVKQTIVETIEAPRLKDVETSDFVKFKELRKRYEEVIAEKNQDPNVNFTMTSYKSSIPTSILQLFVLADWVPAETVESITEAQLKNCIEARACIAPSEYDLALIESELKEVKQDRKKGTLVKQIWSLVLLYMRTLENCGYKKFVEEQPKLAVSHILKRIDHRGLKTRMLLTFKLREDELESNFKLFIREMAKEAESIDRQDAARRCRVTDDLKLVFDDKHYEKPKSNGRRSASGRSENLRPRNHDNSKTKTAKSGRTEKRERELPPCLNKKCGKKHFIDQCDLTSPEEAKKLKKEYYESKKKRKTEDGKGGMNSLSYNSSPAKSSTFDATFCGSAVTTSVLADTGSDATVVSKKLFSLICLSLPGIQAANLKEPVVFANASLFAEPITCNMSFMADVELQVRHSETLILRRVKWLICEQELAHAYIGRPLLDILGINTSILMAAVRDRFNGEVDVQSLEQSEINIASGKHPNQRRSIRSISSKTTYDYGATYHSTRGDEDDLLDDSKVYIDLGEDDPEELEAALKELVTSAAKQGLSKKGQVKLWALLQKHKKIFRIRLGKSEPAKVPPMKIRLKKDCNPVRVRSRRYNAEKRKFMDKYVAQLIKMGFWIEMPTAEWQAAPLIVPKPNSRANWRMTVDTRPVNAATIQEAWPMPHLEAEINDFKGSDCFALIDFVSGYWQLLLDEDSWTACGVVTPTGVCASKRVLPGLTNSGAHFQRTVEPCFAEPRQNLKAWLDDFSLHAKGEDELLSVLERFFEICDERNLFLSALKCELFTRRMRWCGRIISAAGYEMDPRRLDALKDMAEPETADELAEFVYCARWMSNSIPAFAKRVSSLVDTLEEAFKKSGKRTKRSIKKYKLRELSWGTPHIEAFQTIQENLREAVKLSYIDPDKVTCIFTDASDKHWSGVVTQTTPEDLIKPTHEQRHEPLAFLGSAFRGAQLHWSTFEKEAFAIFQTFERMDYLLQSTSRSHVFTDHRNLLFVFAPLALEPALGRHIVSKVQRWALFLSRFSYSIEHISGEDNVCADMLTRWTRNHRSDRSLPQMCSLLLQSAEQLIPRPTDIVWPDIQLYKESQQKETERPDGLVQDPVDKLWKKHNCIWIPENDRELQLKALVISHCGSQGHRGKEATLSLLSESVWWSHMDESVEKLVEDCLHCIMSRSGRLVPRPLGTAIHGTKPNEVLHMDYLYMGPSTKGENYVLIIKDDFSSFVWLWPSIEASSEVAADALTTWMGSFGATEWLVSDQGTHFKNELLRILTSEYRTKHHFTTAYTPWANGTVERVCREVLRACKALLSEWRLAEEDWPAVTECIQSILNHSPVRRLGRRKGSPAGVHRSPLEVFTGQRPSRPLLRALPVSDFLHAKTEDEIQARKTIGIDELQHAIGEMHREVNSLISKSRLRKIQAHNRNTNVQPANFSVGDWVLVRKAKRSSHKLGFTWIGPKRILDCKSDWVYVIEDFVTKKQDTVHARRLIRYRAGMDGQDVSDDLLKSAEHSTTCYSAVSEIRDISEKNGEVFLQIEWEGLPDVIDWTWEPLKQAYEDVPDMVQNFLHSTPTTKAKSMASRTVLSMNTE